MAQAAGTQLWMPPEALKHEPYTEAFDCYSYAILLSEVWAERLPYSDKDEFYEVHENVDQDYHPECAGHWFEEWWSGVGNVMKEGCPLPPTCRCEEPEMRAAEW